MRAVKALLLLVPLLAATACGGGGDDGKAGARAKADFVKQAEVICAKANKDKNALKKPMSTADLGTYVHSLVMIADESTTALLKLDVPKDDKKDLDSHVLDPLSKQLEKARTFDTAMAKAVKDNDQVAIVKLLKDPPTKTTADLGWMRIYGFKECVTAADTGS